jgi:hypothetical protein
LPPILPTGKRKFPPLPPRRIRGPISIATRQKTRFTSSRENPP